MSGAPDTAAVRLRDARPDEREAIAALTLAAYGEYATAMPPAAWAALEQALRAALATTGPVERVVAERGGALVGSVMLFPPAAVSYGSDGARVRWPELRLLAVAPAGRGLGVGRQLVDECARRARLAGATELGLHTSRSMRAAMRLYARMGFERAPEYDFQPPGAELVQAYRLPLAAPDAAGAPSPHSGA